MIPIASEAEGVEGLEPAAVLGITALGGEAEGDLGVGEGVRHGRNSSLITGCLAAPSTVVCFLCDGYLPRFRGPSSLYSYLALISRVVEGSNQVMNCLWISYGANVQPINIRKTRFSR